MCPFKVGDTVRLKAQFAPNLFYDRGGKITSISPCENFIRFNDNRSGWSHNQYEKVEDMATKKEHSFYVVYNSNNEEALQECMTLVEAQKAVKECIEDEYNPIDSDGILILVPFQKVKEVKVEFEEC